MTTAALLHSTIRAEEKLIIDAAKKRKVKIRLIDVREEVFNPQTYKSDFDFAIQRSISSVKGMYATEFLENMEIKVFNASLVSRLCEDKFLTSLVLCKSKVPTLKFALVFDEKSALQAVEEMDGFPVVIKPPLGSWGRLLAKVNDTDSLEAILEHKNVLGYPQQKAFYIQEYVKKPGRDIRAFVIGSKAICAIYRDSPHWITNTARGGKASNCLITKELAQLCNKASDAIGGGILAMDIFETDDGLKINEVNHTMEFRNSEKPTGVSISGEIIDYCLKNI